MEINVKVVVEFGEKTLKVLQGLGKVYAVVQPKEEEKKAVEAVKEVKKAVKKETAKEEKVEVKEEPKKEVEKEEPVEEEAEKVVTLDELRAAFAEKNSTANRGKLKDIINGLGAEKLTLLPEDKYAEALELVEAL